MVPRRPPDVSPCQPAARVTDHGRALARMPLHPRYSARLCISLRPLCGTFLHASAPTVLHTPVLVEPTALAQASMLEILL